MAASIALIVSGAGLVLNEITGQSLVLFRLVVFVGPISAALLGYALTPALLARRRVARLPAVWAMALGMHSLGTVPFAAFLIPSESVFLSVITLIWVVFWGLPMLVLIVPCAMAWAAVTRRIAERHGPWITS